MIIRSGLSGLGERLRIAHAKVAKVGKESRYANVRNPDRVGAGFECGFEFCVAALADLARGSELLTLRSLRSERNPDMRMLETPTGSGLNVVHSLVE